MKRGLRWIGIVLGVLIGLIAVAVAAAYFASDNRINTIYDIEADAITIPTGTDAISRGEHLVDVICKSCHRVDLGGQLMFEAPGMATIYAANLTPGRGGIGDHSDADLVRAIRHAIDRDGRPLMIMPAEIFVNLSAEDLGAVIAYLRTLPPIDNEVPELNASLLGRVLLTAGMFGQPFPAEYIAHDQPFPEMPVVGASAAYGEYLATAIGCTLCHGLDMTGGVVPAGAPPGLIPLSPNLTPAGALADWTEVDFIQTLRSGVTPDGHVIDPEIMPWDDIYSKLHDDELQGLWLYLQSLPPTETSN